MSASKSLEKQLDYTKSCLKRNSYIDVNFLLKIETTEYMFQLPI